MKINKKLIQLISICLILLQINSMFLKDKPSISGQEKTSDIEESKTDCITLKDPCITEPTKPTAPKAPLGFCKKVKETCGEKVILKKADGKPEKVIKKENKPIEKIIKTITTDGDSTEEIIKKEVKPAKISTPFDDKREVIKKEVEPTDTSSLKNTADEIITANPKSEKDIVEIIKKKDADEKFINFDDYLCDFKKPEIAKEISDRVAEKVEPTKKEEIKEVKPKKEIIEVIKEERPSEIGTLEVEKEKKEKITPTVIPILKAKKTLVAEKAPKCDILVEHKKIGADILNEIKGGLLLKDKCNKGFIQLNSILRKKWNKFPEEIFNKAIAKSDCLTDKIDNSKAKGKASKKSEINLDVNNKDIASSNTISKGKLEEEEIKEDKKIKPILKADRELEGRELITTKPTITNNEIIEAITPTEIKKEVEIVTPKKEIVIDGKELLEELDGNIPIGAITPIPSKVKDVKKTFIKNLPNFGNKPVYTNYKKGPITTPIHFENDDFYKTVPKSIPRIIKRDKNDYYSGSLCKNGDYGFGGEGNILDKRSNKNPNDGVKRRLLRGVPPTKERVEYKKTIPIVKEEIIKKGCYEPNEEIDYENFCNKIKENIPEKICVKKEEKKEKPKLKATPIVVKEAPIVVKEAPIEVKEVPIEVKEAPIEVKEAPIEVKEAPICVKEAPICVKEEPICVKEAPKEIEIKKPITCKYDHFKFPNTDEHFKCDFDDHEPIKEIVPNTDEYFKCDFGHKAKKVPILKSGNKKEKEDTIDLKAHVGGFIDNNANKIKGVSAHYLDAINVLTDKKIKGSYNQQ